MPSFRERIILKDKLNESSSDKITIFNEIKNNFVFGQLIEAKIVK